METLADLVAWFTSPEVQLALDFDARPEEEIVEVGDFL